MSSIETSRRDESKMAENTLRLQNRSDRWLTRKLRSVSIWMRSFLRLVRPTGRTFDIACNLKNLSLESICLFDTSQRDRDCKSWPGQSIQKSSLRILVRECETRLRSPFETKILSTRKIKARKKRDVRSGARITREAISKETESSLQIYNPNACPGACPLLLC